MPEPVRQPRLPWRTSSPLLLNLAPLAVFPAFLVVVAITLSTWGPILHLAWVAILVGPTAMILTCQFGKAHVLRPTVFHEGHECAAMNELVELDLLRSA